MIPWQQFSNKPAMLLAVMCTLVPFCNATLLAGDSDCGVPPGTNDYVGSCSQLVAQGVALDEVLDVLSCLACSNTNTFLDTIQGPRAVRAIFRLCDSDACIRRVLFEIIEDREVPSGTRGLACHILVYVANAEVGARLLVLAKETWPNSHEFSGYANALQDIGSLDFLRWIDSTVENGLKDGTFVQHQVIELRRCAKHIRIQENPNGILDYLSSFDGSIDPRWAVHQALRHGINRDLIRSAVLSGLANGKDDRNKIVHFDPLLSDCEALGLLSSEEVRQARVFPLNSYIIREKRRPHWADSKLEAKRRAFWRIDRLSDNSGK